MSHVISVETLFQFVVTIPPLAARERIFTIDYTKTLSQWIWSQSF